MNSNPYALPAYVALAVILIACITGLTAVRVRAPRLLALPHRTPQGRHTRGHLGRHEFDDPADTADPDGEQFVADLAGDTTGTDAPDWLDEDETDIGWQDQQPLAQPVVITGDAARLAQTSELTLNVLQRVRDSLLALGPGSGDSEGDDPCDTGSFPALRITPAQEADRLAAKYLTAEVTQ